MPRSSRSTSSRAPPEAVLDDAAATPPAEGVDARGRDRLGRPGRLGSQHGMGDGRDTQDRPGRGTAGTPDGRDAQEETLAVLLAALRPSLEAVLMVADQPLDTVTLASAVGYPVEEVTAALGAGRGVHRAGSRPRAAQRGRRVALLHARGVRRGGRGLRARRPAGGSPRRRWRPLPWSAYAAVPRARVSAIRGVNVDGVMRTLLARGLVEEAGQDHETGANLYRTTNYFLERIGVTSIDELPELAPYLPDMDDMEDELAEVAQVALAGGAPEAGGDTVEG